MPPATLTSRGDGRLLLVDVDPATRGRGGVAGLVGRVPVADCSAPLVGQRSTSSGQVATPDRASEQVKCTVTGPAYQPLAVLVPLVIAPVMVGAVLSSLTVTESVPTLPAVSFAEPVTTLPGRLGAMTVTGAGDARRRRSPCRRPWRRRCTVTSLLFQSSAFGFGRQGVGRPSGRCCPTSARPLLDVSTLPALSTA